MTKLLVRMAKAKLESGEIRELSRMKPEWQSMTLFLCALAAIPLRVDERSNEVSPVSKDVMCYEN